MHFTEVDVIIQISQTQIYLQRHHFKRIDIEVYGNFYNISALSNHSRTNISSTPYKPVKVLPFDQPYLFCLLDNVKELIDEYIKYDYLRGNQLHTKQFDLQTGNCTYYALQWLTGSIEKRFIRRAIDLCGFF